jgi:hypothetical protein
MNNQQTVFDLYRRIEAAYNEGNIDELEWIAQNLKGIEIETFNKIEELKNNFKRNIPVNLLQTEIFNRFK